MSERSGDAWPLVLIAIIAVGLAFLAVVGYAIIQDDERVDAVCAAHKLTGEYYSHRVGRTELGKRMCVDESTGQVYDPDFMK